MRVGWFVTAYLLGVASMTTALVVRNTFNEAVCAKQFNVYSCNPITVYMPLGAK